MRLIDADTLINNNFKNDISYKAFVNLVKRQQTVEPEPQWIPVTEQLPDNCISIDANGHELSDYFIVCCVDDEGDFECSSINIALYDFTEQKWKIELDEFEIEVNVSAWMPLPEPYKGEQDE